MSYFNTKSKVIVILTITFLQIHKQIFGLRIVIQGQDFEEPCNRSSDCNPMGSLICIDHQCDCMYDWMVYCDYKVKCLSTVNQMCDSRSELKLFECVDNASCVNLLDSKFEPFPVPKCICDHGYVPVSKLDCSDDESTDGSIPFQICCPKKMSKYTEEVDII